MPALSFAIQDVTVTPFAAAPTLGFEIQIINDGKEAIHTVALRCQIQIEPTRRQYTAADREHLLDLFGEVSRWGQTLRPMLWTHANVVVPSFQGSTTCELPVPCTFDFNVGATKYFYGLEDGAVPVCLQFSGTVFYENENGVLQAAPIAWDREARFELPVKSWKKMMDSYYPDSAWLYLRRDVFDRLNRYKVQNMIPTWEETLERISLTVPGAAHR